MDGEKSPLPRWVRRSLAAGRAPVPAISPRHRGLGPTRPGRSRGPLGAGWTLIILRPGYRSSLNRYSWVGGARAVGSGTEAIDRT